MAVVVVQKPGGPAGQQITSAAASKEVKSSAHWAFFVIGFALVAAGWAWGYRITTQVKPVPFTPVEGISIFAVMYVFAQALERFLEPILRLYSGKKDDTKVLEGALEKAINNPSKANLKLAANAREELNEEGANLAVLAWGLSSALAMLGSGYLGMYLLRAVGLTSVPASVDILVTGLAVGGGTKPLHDLVKNIEKAKEEKDDEQKVQTLQGDQGRGNGEDGAKGGKRSSRA